MSNFAFQVTKAFQGNGEFAFQGQTGVTPPVKSVVGGSGKRKHNEIIELNGVRFSVPKDRVGEFLERFQPELAQNRTQASSEPFFKPETVRFLTPSGLTVTTTRQVLTDDIGLILVMAALADEDFYED